MLWEEWLFEKRRKWCNHARLHNQHNKKKHSIIMNKLLIKHQDFRESLLYLLRCCPEMHSCNICMTATCCRAIPLKVRSQHFLCFCGWGRDESHRPLLSRLFTLRVQPHMQKKCVAIFSFLVNRICKKLKLQVDTNQAVWLWLRFVVPWSLKCFQRNHCTAALLVSSTYSSAKAATDCKPSSITWLSRHQTPSVRLPFVVQRKVSELVGG